MIYYAGWYIIFYKFQIKKNTMLYLASFTVNLILKKHNLPSFGVNYFLDDKIVIDTLNTKCLV